MIIKIIIMWALQTPLGKTHTHTRVAAIICMCAWVCMSHRGVVGPLRRKAILGPLDVCRRLGPTSHTGQVVWSTSHQQELRGSLDHWVLRGDWRGDMQIHIFKWHIYVSVNTYIKKKTLHIHIVNHKNTQYCKKNPFIHIKRLEAWFSCVSFLGINVLFNTISFLVKLTV